MTRARRWLACALGAALFLTAAPAWSAKLDREPYLQQVTDHSAIVVWRTTKKTKGVLRVGDAPGKLDRAIPSGDGKKRKQHEVRVDGLKPGQVLYYSVGTPKKTLAGDAREYRITAMPKRGTRAPLRMWVVGDSGTGDDNQAAVRDAMLSFTALSPPQVYLHMGDMAYKTGKDGQFTENFFAPYRSILRHTPVWPTMGNHEGKNSDAPSESGPYYEAYVLPRGGEAGGQPSGTEAYYAFDIANAHFIVLESHQSSRAPDGPMLQWLKQDIASTDQEWVIAFWHHPPYTKGSHDSDTERRLVEMRENALPILEAGGVDLVLGGHSHIYERSFLLSGAYQTPSTKKGIVDKGDGKVLGTGPYTKPLGRSDRKGAVYVVAGHGGKKVRAKGRHPLMAFTEVAFGSCILDLDDNRLALANVRGDGEVTDRFTLVKGDALIVGAPDGGEPLAAGAATTIRWATVGKVDEVRVEWSADDGKTWELVADKAPNTGSLPWTPPKRDVKAARVRVSSIAKPAMADVSNGAFTITTGPITKPQVKKPSSRCGCTTPGRRVSFDGWPWLLGLGLGLCRRRW